MKEKVLRNTQIRRMRDMGEMKRAQELRVDEFSVQKLRENQKTMQQVTSQLQQMQEQINSMNDSGDFQEVESKYSRSCPTYDNFKFSFYAEPRQTSASEYMEFNWITGNVFGNQSSTFDSPTDHPQGIQSDDVQ